ncbi:Flavin-dependent oxidoreductase, luciferase family (includes alkanesulfonate monooxygenase SsuD and methylene tetrahydromethanopterin reductase) [Micromonospora matsumotoense]|uniref:Flavin-dependent oxidoreductase, luciferase family (Includes alkanesulfonate monooxygenase SsuD and methylene tetrahydromethanopterin reductase) n=1 Tax=Micromonospora matsumotoense TaxID=121616 RepID=A0A1C4VAV1_9ACTN|nr:LLM class flavin-dependent oxidoreductase [Micromonospora matsumotoense]SCE81016.1 Flavin-dependent oxidoreductase, luciferase family (includes alkanesulfonate monooxygenase SsuD and methylene tetrahydromethanopterin reductase) [Micromonospora matsumotoense]
MTDYGHELLFGGFLTPDARQPAQVVARARLCEQVGLDLVTFQDHPYQPGFLDTWTLMSYLAAATSRIRLAGNVLNLPLRQPVVLARSVASLDLLSGGRVELGLGTGAFWDAIEANGGRRLAPGQAVDALDEAIRIIREVWAADRRGGVRVDGEHYRVLGAKRGPAPAHPVGIWVGAYKPRLLRLVGRTADGWLPSLSYLPKGSAELADLNALVDEGASAAGRDPAEVRRLLNVSGRFTRAGAGFLDGPPQQWARELADLVLTHGTSGFILGTDDPTSIQLFAQEVAPAVRELVAAERAGSTAPGSAGSAGSSGPAGEGAPAGSAEDAPAGSGSVTPAGSGEGGSAAGSGRPAGAQPGEVVRAGGIAGLAVTPTPAPQVRHSDHRLWDESTRPVAPPAPQGHVYSPQAQAAGGHLVDVHDHLRRELSEIRDLLDQVRRGVVSAGDARGVLNRMTLRQNNWTLGAYCAAYCTLVTQHHGLEDDAIFPHLRRADPGLVPVIDRLAQEHVVIHDVVEGVDRALVALIEDPGRLTELQRAVDVLTDTLLSHLSYEEQNLVEPLARYGFYPGQL